MHYSILHCFSFSRCCLLVQFHPTSDFYNFKCWPRSQMTTKTYLTLRFGKAEATFATQCQNFNTKNKHRWQTRECFPMASLTADVLKTRYEWKLSQKVAYYFVLDRFEPKVWKNGYIFTFGLHLKRIRLIVPCIHTLQAQYLPEYLIFCLCPTNARNVDGILKIF